MTGMLSGPVPIKLHGRVPSNDNEGSRLNIEADLTPAKIDNLLPGWTKASGRPARATFTMVTKSDRRHALRGHGDRGARHLGQGHDRMRWRRQHRERELPGVQPVGRRQDHAAGGARAGRHAAGDPARRRLRRPRPGEDRRSSGASNGKQQKQHDSKDIDLDVKIGTVAGFHGETLRGLDLKMSRRSGIITNFALNAKIGRGSPVSGDLRRRSGSTRQVMYRRERRCRRVLPLQRHLRQDHRRRDVGGDGPAVGRTGAAGRHSQHPRFRRARRIRARPRRRRSPPASSSRASSSRGCASTSPARSDASRSAKDWCAGR